MSVLTPAIPAPSRGRTYTRIDYSRYVVVPVWYYCNSKCTFCMVEQQMAHLPTVDLETFRGVLRDVMQRGVHDNLILSGGEVTIFDKLPEYIEAAASFGCFRRIQIQTNGRRLANREYAERLVRNGLNEAFVSFHGLEAVHDAITCVKGGWQDTMRGIENLAALGVNLITNTVVTKQNFDTLVDTLRLIATLPVSEMHVWNYFPMAGEDTKDLLVSMRDFYARLPDLLAVVEPTGRALTFKGFPECLSLGRPGFFNNLFPLNLIDKAFWDNFDENQFGSCVHRERCSARGCFGLSSAYVKKFGLEADLLCPKR